MRTEIIETRLLGVGIKHSFTSARGSQVAVILRHDGRCDIYAFARPGVRETHAVIELDADETRQLGAILSRPG